MITIFVICTINLYKVKRNICMQDFKIKYFILIHLKTIIIIFTQYTKRR